MANIAFPLATLTILVLLVALFTQGGDNRRPAQVCMLIAGVAITGAMALSSV